MLYKAYYKLGLELSVCSIRKIPAVSSIYVRRSFSNPGWIPGYSDIDLAIVISVLAPAEETLVLQMLCRILKLCRVVFPFVSDVAFIVNEVDLSRWLSYGNIRRLEFDSWLKRYG